jgi:hypothetical protein
MSDDPLHLEAMDAYVEAMAAKKPKPDDATKARLDMLLERQLDRLELELNSTEPKVRREALRSLLEARTRWLT